VRTLNAVIRRAPPEMREWGTAMLREMDFIESDWDALVWAFGGAKSVITMRKRSETMRGQEINRISGNVLIVLSLIALLMVISGYFQAPQPDEGSAAHIFQLSIVALVPMILLFLVTVDWEKPLRNMRPLVFTVVTLVLAFGGLYYLEHHYYVEHYVKLR
jgi:heme/copper-type cytochrome/quinol oxidase subunit 4